MTIAYTAANLSTKKVHDIRRIATGLQINHRENGIRLKKNKLIRQILMKQNGCSEENHSDQTIHENRASESLTRLPAEAAQQKDGKTTKTRRYKKSFLHSSRVRKSSEQQIMQSLPSLFAAQQKRQPLEADGDSANLNGTTPPEAEGCDVSMDK